MLKEIIAKCGLHKQGNLLVLASGGLRAVEGCAIRIKDINFKVRIFWTLK
jgi:integrase